MFWSPLGLCQLTVVPRVNSDPTMPREVVMKNNKFYPNLFFILGLLLACQWTPQPTRLSTPPPIHAQAVATWTSTPTPTECPTTSPTPTAPRPPAVPPTPRPAAGPLPAVWTTLDFGLPAGDLYFPTSLAFDRDADLLYALGQCELEPGANGSSPRACISTFNLDSAQIVRHAEIPAGNQGHLLLAGDTLYLDQAWRAALLVIDAETLHVRRVISDVVRVADDGRGTIYAVTTERILRLEADPIAAPLPWHDAFGGSILDMIATPERIYVLTYEWLWVFDPTLAPAGEIDLQGVDPRTLAFDNERERLYVGGNAGLFALNLDDLSIEQTQVDVQGIDRLLVDAANERLYVSAHHPYDWFGGAAIVAIDMTSWQTKTLFSTLDGWLTDLALDPGRERLLVASQTDHALIPIELASGAVGRRLPLGVEVIEVIVDEQLGRLYVSDSAGWINVLDRRSYAPIERVYGGRRISLDVAHKRLYAGDPRLPVVSVFDVETLNSLHEIPQPGKPRANGANGELVIVNRRFYVFDGATGSPTGELLPGIGIPLPEFPGGFYTIAREALIDAERGLTATITYTPWPGKPGPQASMVYDPGSGRAYRSLLTGGYIHHSTISIYADLGALQTRAPAILSLDGLSGHIALDSRARRLYVARGHILFVLDSETLRRVGRVETGRTGANPWLPRIAAVDQELGRLYNPRENELVVWTRNGSAPPRPQPHEPMIVTHTISSIRPSPNFAADRTLLATINSRLCRSTDGGETWLRLRGGLPELGGWIPTIDAVFSPDYANDSTILAGIFLGDSHGEGVWKSTDGGETWLPSSDGLYDLRVHRLALSPDYANDSTALAYTYSQNVGALYRSVDGGASWQLVLRQAGYAKPPLPRPEELFLVAQHPPQFKCDYEGVCQRSDDGGETWLPFDTGRVKLKALVATVISPHLKDDGAVYFMTQSDLYRVWPDGDAWERAIAPIFDHRDDYTRYLTALAIAPGAGGSDVLFIGTADGQFYRRLAGGLTWKPLPPRPAPTATPAPTRAATPTSTPKPCTGPIDERFYADYAKLPPRLGCAAGAGVETRLAEQPFEMGIMLWRQDRREIYVLYYDATWEMYEDTWDETQPDRDPNLEPPTYFYQPLRGFGKVWREKLGGVESTIGWATDVERNYDTVIQPFDNGQLLKGDENYIVFVLYNDGHWEEINAYPPE